MSASDPLPDPRRAATLEELRDAASLFVRHLSCDYFAYLLLRPPTGTVLPGDILLSDYPDEWQQRYRARHYKYYDPVVTISHNPDAPFFYWGQRGFLDPHGKAARLVFHEAAEFHILEGCGVPTAGAGGDGGVFSMSVSQRGHVDEILENRQEMIQVFAAEFHRAAVKLTCGDCSNDAPDLTPRQREVLSWTAEGLSSEATAERIGISTSAVNYHLGLAARRLGAANKIQAVALAIRRGLI
ncbi:MAG: LuxR family transcriptional regulator [Proteobacteria bacterium]|nr:LuxR family transcriptional regulator [Pseudomonadota bacterium]